MQARQVRKLGFREKDEYFKLEKQIEDATEEKAQLEAKIAETAQLGDFEKVASLTEQLPVLSDKIDTMTDRCRPLCLSINLAAQAVWLKSGCRISSCASQGVRQHKHQSQLVARKHVVACEYDHVTAACAAGGWSWQSVRRLLALFRCVKCMIT